MLRRCYDVLMFVYDGKLCYTAYLIDDYRWLKRMERDRSYDGYKFGDVRAFVKVGAWDDALDEESCARTIIKICEGGYDCSRIRLPICDD